MTYFTDAEAAVIYDSLAHMRDWMFDNRPDIANGYGTPNIDSALAKLDQIITPNSDGLLVEAGARVGVIQRCRAVEA